MLKGSRRGNFVSTLNKPVVIHKIGKPQHVSKDEILRFLDDFITSKEAFIDNNSNSNNNATNIDNDNDNDSSGNHLQGNQIATTGGASDIILNIDTNLTSSLSQLKRIQRDFKGLPPHSAALSSIKIDNTDDIRTGSENTEQGKEDKISKSATGGTKKTFAD